ncbi:MAG: NTP transferase domain-containing protein [Lapillicoccus sp.]
MDVTALVLCGGSSRRLGRDKLAEPLGSTTVLDVTLAGLPVQWSVVCVGPERPTARGVAWTLEQPPGGGPVPAIAAGLAQVTTPVVVVIAGDMPFAGPWAVRLADAVAASAVDAVAARDGDDRLNPLLCAYRTASLRAAMPLDPAGRPARQLLLGLGHDTLRVPEVDAVDVDTPEALAAARRRVGP